MLRFLGVRHLAVIDHLEVEFEPGLNVLTGETGAGKSILIEAIDLLVGGRASADLVRTGEAAAHVQAVFERPDGRDVIVRREISSQGRSRAFIDDALATLSALKSLGGELADLHGQHEHQTLLDPRQHITYLDAFLEEDARRADVARRYDAWQTALATLERSQLDDREKKLRIEMASFQRQEIAALAPVAGEDEALEAERTVLLNADRLARLSSEAYARLYEREDAALATLSGVWKRVAELASIDARFAAHLDQRDSIQSALDDLAFFLRSYVSDLDASPDRLQAVEDRLAALARVKKKYGPSLEAVLARLAALDEELASLGAGEDRIAEWRAHEDAARQAFLSGAGDLSARRQRGARRLGADLERVLADLAMPDCRVDVRVRPAEQASAWTASGIDDVEFFLSPNPGEDLRPLARIASGGELSRIMLALHTLASVGAPGRVLVFDEVDAGIGGAAADAVGRSLQELGRRYQVLCITHLPQIAARAGTHVALSKRVQAGRTTTTAIRLTGRGREEEIARMIAGAGISEQVRASARDLLAGASEGSEHKPKAKGESESDRGAKAKVRGKGRG